MPRLPYVLSEDLSNEDRPLLGNPPANISRILAHAPDGLRGMRQLGDWIRHHSSVDPRLRELAILEVGYVSGCTYEYAHHIEVGLQFGVTENDLKCLATENSGERSSLGSVERAVIAAAREATLGFGVSATTFSELRDHLSPGDIVALLMAIGSYNHMVRMIQSFEPELEEGLGKLLEQFPIHPSK